MSKTRLSVFLSGTHMTWEDTALFFELGARDRHNLKEGPQKSYYYIFDGPAAQISDQHKPVEHTQFDQKQDDLMNAHPRKMNNSLGNAYRWAKGSGMTDITHAAYQLILHSITDYHVRQIDLFGFSRGGNIALNIGSVLAKLEKDLKNKLSQEDLNSIEVNIYAIDPVAGKSNNHKSHQLGTLSPFVKKCVVGLATNESVPGFHPRGILSFSNRYNIEFSPVTKYIVLPFPEDHAMCMLWMKDIIRSQLPPDSALLSPCDEKRLIERRLGMKEVKWLNKPDETRAYRLIHYQQNKATFSRSILPIKNGIELFFKYIGTQRTVYNVGHISLQNAADSEMKNRVYAGKKIGGARLETQATQMKYAKRNHSLFNKTFGFTDRACKEKISQFTNHLFVNPLHESMFIKAYPALYQLFSHHAAEDINNAIKEFSTISEEHFPFTKAYIENALICLQDMTLKSLHEFKTTNVKNHEELFNMIFPNQLDNKLESRTEIDSEIESKDCKIIHLKKLLFDSTTVADEKKSNIARTLLS